METLASLLGAWDYASAFEIGGGHRGRATKVCSLVRVNSHAVDYETRNALHSSEWCLVASSWISASSIQIDRIIAEHSATNLRCVNSP